jgi:hypothetical protein
VTIRIRHPFTPPADKDLGPGAGLRHRYDIMARDIDTAIGKQWPQPHGSAQPYAVAVESSYRQR